MGPLRRIAALVIVVASTSAACGSTTGTPPAPTATPGPTPTPTSSLFGHPPPVDPCDLLEGKEIVLALQLSQYSEDLVESSGGATATCVYDTGQRGVMVRVTVFKETRTEEQFAAEQLSFGRRATEIEDLGVPAYMVVFGPLATAYGLKDGVEIFIDIQRDPASGGEVALQAAALLERALSRLP
jgi:hypothetical protein